MITLGIVMYFIRDMFVSFKVEKCLDDLISLCEYGGPDHGIEHFHVQQWRFALKEILRLTMGIVDTVPYM